MNYTTTLMRSLAAAALGLGLAAPLQAAITDDLVAHLTFDTDYNDSSGRGNHGTEVGAPTRSPGLIGANALNFSSVADGSAFNYVSLGKAPDLDFGDSTTFSISLWAKMGTWTGDPAFLSNKDWTGGGNTGYVLATGSDGRFQWNYREVGNSRKDYDGPAGTFSDGAWHHLVLVCERGGNARTFVDGLLVNTQPLRTGAEVAGSIDTSGDGLDTNIGMDGMGTYTDGGGVGGDGSIDDVGIWRRALTDAEIAAITANGQQGRDLTQAGGADVHFLSDITPSANQTAAGSTTLVGLRYNEGASPVNLASVQMTFDGVDVVPATSQSGKVTSIFFTPPAALASGSTHTATVQVSDSATPAKTLTMEWSFTVATYITISPESARAAGSANTPGFTVRSAWAASVSPDLASTLARARAQLDGTLLGEDNLPLANDATPGPNSDGSYNIDGVINFDQDTKNSGHFPNGELFPGIADPAANSFSDYTFAYLDLPVGHYRLGVNSDDGFEARLGFNPRGLFESVVIGSFDGTRGAADSLFDFYVAQAGVYALGVIHIEGGGDANLEVFSVDTGTGAMTLVNDLSDAKAIKAFRKVSPDVQPPYVKTVSPGVNATDVKVTAPIIVTVADGTTTLAPASVQMQVNGTTVAVTSTKAGATTTLTYDHATPFDLRKTNLVSLVFGDGTVLITNSWAFKTQGADQTPSITGQWDFDQGNLAATIGAPMEYLSQDAEAASQYGSTAEFGLPKIAGEDARVMRFAGSSSNTIAYVCHHGAVPNGGGSKVNQWTLVMDVLFPTEVTAGWFSFCQIDTLDNTSDGDLFVNFANRADDPQAGGIGIGGTYASDDGTTYIKRGQWHRVVFAADSTSTNEFAEAFFNKYIDGVKVGVQKRGQVLDGRHSLQPTFLLFADDDGESQLVYVNSVQVRNYQMLDAEVAALGTPQASGIPTVTGQWDFTSGDLAPTIGSPLAYRGNTDTATSFSTVQIGGQDAAVMGFPAADKDQGYLMYHGGVANGGGERLNQYTLVMDLMFPAASTGQWRGLLQTDTNNANDGELFVNAGNGIGISSQYAGTLEADTWYRVAFAFDLTSTNVGKYINGSLVGLQTLSATDGRVDQRWSLGLGALLFSDEDGETAAGFVNSVQFRPLRLSDAQIAALGGPSASGIPLGLPFFQPAVASPRLSYVVAGGSITLSWPADVTGFKLQETTSVGSSWTEVQPVSNNSASVPVTGGQRFFRLSQ